jgi:luciferase-type oxidoreductase
MSVTTSEPDNAEGAEVQPLEFPRLNHAYNSVFQPGKLSLGLVLPIERYPHSAVPTMQAHLARAKFAEDLGFSALWLRDVPFNVPTFGDAGQMFDPFVYLGFLSAHTRRIALGVASVILPLRHPTHVAKAAATADVLSSGRLLLGVASGDRPEEYPAMKAEYTERGRNFRDAVEYIQGAWSRYPKLDNCWGQLSGDVDMLPKPTAGKVPLLITGSSQQNPDWLATHGDGWITYPRDAPTQAQLIQAYRMRTVDAGLKAKPVTQSLYIDLVEDPNAPPQSIHLGFRSGSNFLKAYLNNIQAEGVNHVALNLRFNQLETDKALEQLAAEIVPYFSS